MKIYMEPIGNKDKHEAGMLLLKKAAKELFFVDEFEIYYNQNGKPLTDNFAFNISHSGEYVFAALCENAVGIDAEKCREIKKRESYKLFKKAESEFVNQNENERCKRFFTIFTMKEAYVKMRGLKLSDAAKLNTVENNKIKTDFEGFEFLTKECEGYIITVCAQK